MPFTGDTFTHLFDWEKDPQRQEKIVNARLEAELDGIDTALSSLATGSGDVVGPDGGVADNEIALFNGTTGKLIKGAGAEPLPADEGTWTPVLTFATPGDLSVSYSAQNGLYVRHGKMVFAIFEIATSSFTHTTASGNCTITGLPFSSAASFGQRGGSTIFQGVTKANYTQFTPAIAASASSMTFSASGSGQAGSTIAAADMPTGGSVIFRGILIYYGA